MLRPVRSLVRSFDQSAWEREVEAELQFHIEMQALDYEREGLTGDESLAMAQVRFGDYARVKGQCVQIGMQNSAGSLVQKVLFAMAFCLGVFIRSLNLEFHVTRIGDVLIMIAFLGGLLLMVKRLRNLTPAAPESLPLGLHDSAQFRPSAFDAEGRSPFERVRADDPS